MRDVKHGIYISEPRRVHKRHWRGSEFLPEMRENHSRISKNIFDMCYKLCYYNGNICKRFRLIQENCCKFIRKMKVRIKK